MVSWGVRCSWPAVTVGGAGSSSHQSRGRMGGGALAGGDGVWSREQ